MSTIQELNDALGGQLLSGKPSEDGATASRVDQSLGPIAIDSRRTAPGDVFWAMPGTKHDGNAFVEEAFQGGATVAVVSREVAVPKGCWAVKVADTAEALHRWAAWKRRHFTGTVVGVTGSVGKTTTRQMIHTVLGSRLAGTASLRNLNNHVGVPVSMHNMSSSDDYAVLELGASRQGEIAALAELSAPKVGVVTQVGDAHLGGFGSRSGIAEAKAELLAALPPDGCAILGDDPWLRSMADRCRAKITWVGMSRQCDLVATNITCGQGMLSFHVASRTMALETTDSGVPFQIAVWGRHHLTSALAAIATGRLMGFDFAEMADALADFQPVPMRCEVSEMRGATVINDTYNASPTAMRAALKVVRDFDATGRRVVVCGDMGELGDEAVRLHWQLGKQTVNIGHADMLIACGRYAKHVVAGARVAGMARSRAIPCETVDEALPYLGQAILPGDVVLIKGSRDMAMERVVDALGTYPQRRTLPRRTAA